jgi:hypothetical protein
MVTEVQPLVDMFDQAAVGYDLREGTARSPTGERQIFLSTDVLRGVHDALQYEAGEAWGAILFRCGTLWGERITNRLWRDVERETGEGPEALRVDSFLAWMRGWFRRSGWGDTVFDLRDAEASGVIWVELHFSLFREALEPCPDRADFLVAGLLSAFFSKVSGRPVTAIELPPTDNVVFAISGPERIDEVDEAIEDGADAAEVRRMLIGAS